MISPRRGPTVPSGRLNGAETDERSREMAICLIVENPEQTAEQAEEVLAHVRSTGPVPPEGARLMLAGPANPGWRVISVWESHEARERFFTERLAPAYAEAGLSLDGIEREVFEVHVLAAGDLTGTPSGGG
jgi:hypothetical protein